MINKKDLWDIHKYYFVFGSSPEKMEAYATSIFMCYFSKNCFVFRDVGMLLALTWCWNLTNMWRIVSDQMFRQEDFIFSLVKTWFSLCKACESAWAEHRAAIGTWENTRQLCKCLFWQQGPRGEGCWGMLFSCCKTLYWTEQWLFYSLPNRRASDAYPAKASQKMHPRKQGTVLENIWVQNQNVALSPVCLYLWFLVSLISSLPGLLSPLSYFLLQTLTLLLSGKARPYFCFDLKRSPYLLAKII